MCARMNVSDRLGRFGVTITTHCPKRGWFTFSAASGDSINAGGDSRLTRVTTSTTGGWLRRDLADVLRTSARQWSTVGRQHTPAVESGKLGPSASAGPKDP